MSKTTRATQALAQLGVAFTLHSYDYDPDADSIGLQAAAARWSGCSSRPSCWW
jgi:Cys-tRNA(Pro)/Cys-tRNA(Cys) deacylase